MLSSIWKIVKTIMFKIPLHTNKIEKAFLCMLFCKKKKKKESDLISLLQNVVNRKTYSYS